MTLKYNVKHKCYDLVRERPIRHLPLQEPENEYAQLKWLWIPALVMVLLFGLVLCAFAQQVPVPANLWKGLVAESTRGDLDEYRAIASVVRNRLDKGMWHGLVALKRKNLDSFVAREVAYNPKLEVLAKQAVNDNHDYSNGATHYEHTGTYPTPKWAKNMVVVKVLYKGTKHEITFWKERYFLGKVVRK